MTYTRKRYNGCLALAALVLLAVVSAKKCLDKDFCARWMCEQATNRRDSLRNFCEDKGLDFGAELQDCNNQQTNEFKDTCTLSNGDEVTIGYRYDKTQCDQDVPEQLKMAGKLVVKAEAFAVEGVISEKWYKSFFMADDRQAKETNCEDDEHKPKHPCVCDEFSQNCPETIKEEVLTDTESPYFDEGEYNGLAAAYVRYMKYKALELGVMSSEEEALATATESCKERYPTAPCSEAN